uniref:Uncharacterized protein n=1 Tax=Glossina austeni TaxID=7395 RepID=A0A1A9VNK7_GLOAU
MTNSGYAFHQHIEYEFLKEKEQELNKSVSLPAFGKTISKFLVDCVKNVRYIKSAISFVTSYVINRTEKKVQQKEKEQEKVQQEEEEDVSTYSVNELIVWLVMHLVKRTAHPFNQTTDRSTDGPTNIR